MPKSSLSVSLKGADDIFSTEESRQEQQREQVQQIPIGELFPFKDHPLMSPSRIHSGDFPLFRSVKHCSIASCVLLPIRNP